MKCLLGEGGLEGGSDWAVLACVLKTTTKNTSTFRGESAPLEKILATPMHGSDDSILPGNDQRL